MAGDLVAEQVDLAGDEHEGVDEPGDCRSGEVDHVARLVKLEARVRLLKNERSQLGRRLQESLSRALLNVTHPADSSRD